MRTFLRNLVVASVTLLIVFSTVAVSPAFVPRDAGSKARGEYKFDVSRGPVRNYRPRMDIRQSFSYEPQAETRRSFSYSPAPFHAGEQVTVTVNEGKLMAGTETRGIVLRGQVVTVLQTRGPWLWVQADVKGQNVNGWLWAAHAATEPRAAHPEVTTVPTPAVERRSFSYEPAIPSYHGYRGSRGSSVPKYLLQKTDPNKMR